MRRTAIVVVVAALVGSGKSAQAAPCPSSCSCVTGGGDLGAGVREQAQRARAPGIDDSTLAFDVTLQRVTVIDSLLPATPPRIFRDEVTVEHFVVHRAWALRPGPALNRRIDNFVLPGRLCPRPSWRRGKRYLVFATVVDGRIELREGCADITYPARARGTRRAFHALNASWSRR